MQKPHIKLFAVTIALFAVTALFYALSQNFVYALRP